MLFKLFIAEMSMFLKFHDIFNMMTEAYPPQAPAPPAAPPVATPPPAATPPPSTPSDITPPAATPPSDPTVCNHEDCNKINEDKLKDLQEKFKLLSRDDQRMYLCQSVHYKKADPAAAPPRKRSRVPKTTRTNKER